MFGLKKRRRQKLMQQIFPEHWLSIIHDNVPYFSFLSGKQRAKLLGLIQIFINEKPFEACGGITMTDEIKIIIAAQACILLLGDISDFYPTLRSILVYPHFYYAKIKNQQSDGTVIEGYQGRIGESWSRGHIVLSWSDIVRGAQNSGDGKNVVFHEFAHLLDYENGATLSFIDNDRSEENISQRLKTEYYTYLWQLDHGEETILDLYASTKFAEFFAVSTEHFFEQPARLKAYMPQLYSLLQQFYNQNPIEYFES